MAPALSPREREKLILDHQSTALSTVRKHAPRGVPVEDLRQEAFVALVLAIDTYDPVRGELTTHIYWTVRGAISALGDKEHAQTSPAAGVKDDVGRTVRNRMQRLDEPLVGEDGSGTRLERLEATDPSPEDVAAHREMLATAALVLGAVPPRKGKKRRVVVKGKKVRVDATVLATARSMSRTKAL